MFNNAAYFGISSPTYGTFTMGRQSALTSDLIVNYDSLSGSNAFSLITYQGANGGGGDTENRILDNSYEYRVNVGPVRLAGEIQAKNGGNSATGNAFEGNIGFDYMGFSMDFVGGKIFDAISAAPLSPGQLRVIRDHGRCRQRHHRGDRLRQHGVLGRLPSTPSGRGNCSAATSTSSTPTRTIR